MKTRIAIAVVIGVWVGMVVAQERRELHLRGDRFKPLTWDELTPEQRTMVTDVLNGLVQAGHGAEVAAIVSSLVAAGFDDLAFIRDGMRPDTGVLGGATASRPGANGTAAAAATATPSANSSGQSGLGSLPTTGSRPLDLLIIATALLALGMLAAATARRGRRAETEPDAEAPAM